MASEYIQDFAFFQVSQAVMATANSVAAAASNNSAESSIFDVVRRKWGKVQDVIQGFAAPLKRHSLYDELPEHVWPREHIEMSRMVQRGLGHNFLPCQLSNPTWCDYCGDFIWGVYKQCLRCQTCQYTCHQHCLPAVTLNCKSISDDGFDVAAARTPSPSEPRAHLETSLSMGNITARPGCARVVSSTTDNTTTVPGNLHRVTESAPQLQHGIHGRSDLADAYAGYPGVSSGYPGTPRPTHSASHYLSRSASQGYVTDSSSPVPPSSLKSGISLYSPQGHHISSIRRSPLHDKRANSLPETHIQVDTPRQVDLKTALHNPEPNTVDIADEVLQGISNVIVSDNISKNMPPHIESQDDIVSDLPNADANQEAATEKDETDSGYRSGTIPDDKLPRVPSQATLDRQELSRKIAKFNHFVPAASLHVDGKESFQGFLKVTMNLIRPITMELGARPPSIYELLTREHIVEENTQQVAFYMPRDTHKSLHITSDTTTKEVVTSLLKKFHILDHPRKFAMYEQEFNDRNKLVRLRRLTDKDFPLRALINWDPERIRNYRMVLQENETGEIVWDVFSLPELGNFLKVLDREEKETILELRHKYAYMKQYMERRLIELRSERSKQTKC